MTPSVDTVREVCGMLVVAVYFSKAMTIFRWDEQSKSVTVFGEGGAITAGKVHRMRRSALRAFQEYLAGKTAVSIQ